MNLNIKLNCFVITKKNCICDEFNRVYDVNIHVLNIVNLNINITATKLKIMKYYLVLIEEKIY